MPLLQDTSTSYLPCNLYGKICEGKVFNASIITNDNGEVALKYRKVNPFVPVEGNYPGSAANDFKKNNNTMKVSQLYSILGNSALDRLCHSSYQIFMDGDSLRKQNRPN